MSYYFIHKHQNVFCPHLKGTTMGIKCECASQYIKDIVGIDPRFCRNGRYEACHIYLLSLRNISSEQIRSLQLTQVFQAI